MWRGFSKRHHHRKRRPDAEGNRNQSRLEIEKLLGSKVYLELWVKVKPGWRKRDADLRFRL